MDPRGIPCGPTGGQSTRQTLKGIDVSKDNEGKGEEFYPQRPAVPGDDTEGHFYPQRPAVPEGEGEGFYPQRPAVPGDEDDKEGFYPQRP